MKQQKQFRFGKFLLDILILTTCLICIAAFLTMTYYSLQYWIPTFKMTTTIQAKMFWINLMTAIIYAAMEFVVLFIREFGKTIRNMFWIKDKIISRRFSNEQKRVF